MNEPFITLWENTGLDSCKSWAMFSSTDQYLTLFHVCFCFKMPYLIYILPSLTLNSWPNKLPLLPEQKPPNVDPQTRHTTARLCGETLASTVPGSDFKQPNHQKAPKGRKLGHCSTTRTGAVCELEGRVSSHWNLSWGHACWVTQMGCHSTHLHK